MRINNSGRRRIAALVAVLSVAACTADDNAEPSPSTRGPSSSTVDADPDPASPGDASGSLGLRLSNGTARLITPDEVPLTDGTALDDDARQAVIDRLSPFEDDPALTEDFNRPAGTLRPPIVGETIDVPFPPDGGEPPVVVASGPVEVLRVQPDGNVPIAPYVSITFNQPMVPIGTVQQSGALDVPVTMTPAVAGDWQWIGTRTLRFEADGSAGVDRLPMATEYTVTIPAGTTSDSGDTMAEDATFTFRTPAVQVRNLSPQGENLDVQPVFVATFDQRIDPAAVLATTTLDADGDDVPLRVATDAEVAADDTATSIVAAAEPGRVIAFVPESPLDPAINFTVTFEPGTPSAEGPLTTAAAQSFTGRTFDPLQIIGNSCIDGGCRPGQQVTISFNNALVPSSIGTDAVRITPALPNGQITVTDYGIVISGFEQPDSEYTITVPAALTDVRGQQLGEDRDVSVRIGTAEPTIQQAGQLVTLDPLASNPGLSVLTVSHDELRVRVVRVQPEEWDSFRRFAETGRTTTEVDNLPDWPVLSDTVIDVAADGYAWNETLVPVAELLGGGPGHAVVIVESTTVYDENDQLFWQNQPSISWVQRTSLSIDAMSDQRQLLTWVTDLRTGTPVAGATVTHRNDDAVTGDDGIASFELVENTDGSTAWLVATAGDDTAILGPGYWSSWQRTDEARWFAFSDRGTYRPGETAEIAGWVRRFTAATDGLLTLVEDDVALNWVIADAQGVELATGSSELTPLGGFTMSIDIPAGANLGTAYLSFGLWGDESMPSANGGLAISIEEFRRPEFEVVARSESPAPHRSTQPSTIAVEADYFAGGALAGAPVDWQVTTAEGSYTPPNRSDYTFGVYQPWWWGDFSGVRSVGDFSEPCCFPGPQQQEVYTFQGTTDGAGAHYLQVDFLGTDGALPDLPVTVNAQGTVFDLNRQAWSAATSLLVHPSTLYVGLRSENTFVRPGEPLDIDAIVTDIDGAAVPGRPITVTAERLEWQYVDDTWTEVPVDAQPCEITSAAEATRCSFATTQGGTYRVTAVVADDEGGRNRTELTRWVSGGEARPARGVERQELVVVPAAESFEPGGVAEVLVQAPFTTGSGLATVLRNGITDTIVFDVVDGSAIVQIPIDATMMPRLQVDIEVTGTTPRTADDGSALPGVPDRPAYATTTLGLPVSTASQRLQVTATAGDPVAQPGQDTSVGVTVVDASGSPVAGAEVAVVIADEAVLTLSGYQLGDPIESFYTGTNDWLETFYGRSTIQLVNPQTLVDSPDGDRDKSPASTTVPEAPTETSAAAADIDQAMPAPGTVEDWSTSSRAADESAGGDGSTAGPIEERVNFDALALFEPNLITDANGQISVPFTLPDSLTRYRVMAVAVGDVDSFGSGESALTARLPLMVRPSAPRFANFGDRFELPVLVQNQTDAAMEVDLVLQTANLAVGADDGGREDGRRVTVPANDRVEVRFPVAAVEAGTARFRVAGVSGDAADAAVIELPVYTPATSEAFATYGVIDSGAVSQSLLAPEGVIPQFGGVQITTSSTAVSALTDALIEILDFPYRSADAHASQILTITTLRPVLDAFDAPGLPSAAALDAAVVESIDELVQLQRGDGGWVWWGTVGTSEPFITIHVTHALVAARDAGFDVPRSTLDNALRRLTEIEQIFPTLIDPTTAAGLSAYALHVRDLAGDTDTAQAEQLYADDGDEMQLDALAWLWPVIADPATRTEIERTFANRVSETAAAANFTTNYGDGASLILSSDRRTDGIVLQAMISEQPDSDLIPKVVNGLLGSRVKGRWANIQEDVFILLALRTYFETYEAQTPDFVARAWLGEQYAGERSFQGREVDRATITVPTADLIAAGDTQIVLDKQGTGRMYYRLAIDYAPSDLTLDPLDRGFVVQRTYEGVDDPGDVVRNDDGTWTIEPGARVRVTLTMVADSQRNQVALVDPLPAGLEIINPDLPISQQAPMDSPTDGVVEPERWWWGAWWNHTNERDDRAEAFAWLLPAGTYTYSYIARATTPGTFVVPPPKAEEVYTPETFGRGASDTVIVG